MHLFWHQAFLLTYPVPKGRLELSPARTVCLVHDLQIHSIDVACVHVPAGDTFDVSLPKERHPIHNRTSYTSTQESWFSFRNLWLRILGNN